MNSHVGCEPKLSGGLYSRLSGYQLQAFQASIAKTRSNATTPSKHVNMFDMFLQNSKDLRDKCTTLPICASLTQLLQVDLHHLCCVGDLLKLALHLTRHDLAGDKSTFVLWAWNDEGQALSMKMAMMRLKRPKVTPTKRKTSTKKQGPGSGAITAHCMSDSSVSLTVWNYLYFYLLYRLFVNQRSDMCTYMCVEFVRVLSTT